MGNITKLEKNLNYKMCMKKISDHLNAGSYIDTILFEYTIMEDRLKSVLEHSKNFNKKIHHSLYNKIIKVKEMNSMKDSISKNYISNEILDRINEWRKVRNDIVHDLMNIHHDFEEIKETAINGYEIIKILNNKTTCLNRKLDKILNLQAA